MNKYIDISLPLSPELPHWPGAPIIRFERRLDLNQGDEATDTNVFLNIHTGTHIDAPAHFIGGGKTVDALPLDVFIGPTFVAQVPEHVTAISADILDSLNIPDTANRLLLHTVNSLLWSRQIKEFQSDFAALTADAAGWVVRRGIQLVGIDYLSIQRFVDNSETHRILLEAEVIILEGLNLSSVSSGWYQLICLPIKLQDVEGAPVRALLTAS